MRAAILVYVIVVLDFVGTNLPSGHQDLVFEAIQTVFSIQILLAATQNDVDLLAVSEVVWVVAVVAGNAVVEGVDCFAILLPHFDAGEDLVDFHQGVVFLADQTFLAVIELLAIPHLGDLTHSLIQ